jgi:hypothetical protein
VRIVAPPTALETQLYRSLKAMPCRCEFKRDRKGVPVWEGAPLARARISRCSRCVGVEEYESRYQQEINDG